jgi:hypothetical protein
MVPGGGLAVRRERIFRRAATTRLVIFAAAMAFVEAAVVVYLRELYYPDGFRLPLAAVPPKIYMTEIAREAATIVMLAAVAGLTVKRPLSRFLVFSFCFAVWDIGYYIWLKILLDWPASLLDPDILFLIPVPWVAPVLAPVIVSVCLMAAAVFMDRPFDTPAQPGAAAWIAGIAGGVLVIGSFLTGTLAIIEEGISGSYHWPIFVAGMLVALLGFLLWTAKSRTGRN